MVRYQNEVIRLPDLFVNTDTLKDIECIGCHIQGPGVVWFDSPSITNCSWEGDEKTLFIEVGGGSPLCAGAVTFVNSRFERCKFLRVGVLATAEIKAVFLGATG